MKFNPNKVVFGRHETFAVRYSLLTKGFRALQADPEVFQKALEVEGSVGQRKFDWGTAERIESGTGSTWHQSGSRKDTVIRAEEKQMSDGKTEKNENKKRQDMLAIGKFLKKTEWLQRRLRRQYGLL